MIFVNNLLKDVNIKGYPKGSVIFKEGDQSKEMYIVIEGDVKILKRDTRIAAVGKGQIFGEMALVDKSPRSASAVALTDCKLAAVDERQFITMVQNTPDFALQVMRIMVERLRDTTNLIV